MPDHVYHVSEIVGTAQEGIEEAVRNAVARAAMTLENLDWFEVTDIRGHLREGAVDHFQVTIKVGFRVNTPRVTADG